MSKTLATAGLQELVPMRSHVCLPGDPVLLLGQDAVVALGTGLHPLPHVTPNKISSEEEDQNSNNNTNSGGTIVLAEFCGPVVCGVGPGKVRRYTLDNPTARRYSYAPKDPVVAIVTRKTASYYLCYTGAASLAVLDALSFDGATKASRPRLQEGDVVYAFVRPPPHGQEGQGEREEAELSCLAGEVGLIARDWTSAAAPFGPLAGGTVVRVPLPYARGLLDPLGAARLLTLLGARVPFEAAVGANGLVWVRGQEEESDATAGSRRTVAVASCIVDAQEDTTAVEMEARVRQYFPDE